MDDALLLTTSLSYKLALLFLLTIALTLDFSWESRVLEAAAGKSVLLFREAALVAPSTAAAVRLCRASRGLGAAHYAALSGALGRVVGPAGAALLAGFSPPPRGARHPEDAACVTATVGDGRNVTHCCVVVMTFNGLTGNLLTQSHVLRLFAEINSCAMPWIWYQSGHQQTSAIGPQADWRGEQQWPVVPGWVATESTQIISTSMETRAAYLTPSQAEVHMEVYPENANWQFAALSLGWDLAGDTLIGLGVRGLNADIISGNATAERCERWAAHREACAVAGIALQAEADAAPAGTTLRAQLESLSFQTNLESLHPWISAGAPPERLGIRDAVKLLLDGSLAVTPALRALIAHPERTIVVHIRLDEVYRYTLRGARARARDGLGRGGGDEEWLGNIWHLASGPPRVDTPPPKKRRSTALTCWRRPLRARTS
jgi:hypothetical protein